jgi:hypothetical protein
MAGKSADQKVVRMVVRMADKLVLTWVVLKVVPRAETWVEGLVGLLVDSMAAMKE